MLNMIEMLMKLLTNTLPDFNRLFAAKKYYFGKIRKINVNQKSEKRKKTKYEWTRNSNNVLEHEKQTNIRTYAVDEMDRYRSKF